MGWAEIIKGFWVKASGGSGSDGKLRWMVKPFITISSPLKATFKLWSHSVCFLSLSLALFLLLPLTCSLFFVVAAIIIDIVVRSSFISFRYITGERERESDACARFVCWYLLLGHTHCVCAYSCWVFPFVLFSHCLCEIQIDSDSSKDINNESNTIEIWTWNSMECLFRYWCHAEINRPKPWKKTERTSERWRESESLSLCIFKCTIIIQTEYTIRCDTKQLNILLSTYS